MIAKVSYFVDVEQEHDSFHVQVSDDAYTSCFMPGLQMLKTLMLKTLMLKTLMPKTLMLKTLHQCACASCTYMDHDMKTCRCFWAVRVHQISQ